ncbi:MAG: ZIP family metal transporter [Candidatus Thalassarchaeaceae archaeon]|jgi:zinc transporter ZupT|nr:ZIP family metal transporter [Candidatus Thalassarchaeaceae archaeon]
MTEAPMLYAALTLSIALICGLLPIFSKIKEDVSKLKMLTGVAAGIIIASALLVVIPEGYEIATEDEHDEHDDEASIAGSIALVMLEVDHGEINASQAIEEIEVLVGGHDDHDDHDDHEDEESHDENNSEEPLSESVLHVIEEVEEGEITATEGLEEIEEIITEHSHEEHSHEEEEEHEEHANGLILGGAILCGFLLMLILEGSGIGHAVHEEHHDHSHDHNHGHVHHSSPGWLLVLGLTLHSATDGLAIGAAAASGSAAITATIVFAVLIHKGPAAFSLGIFSMHEREKRNDSIRDVVIFSLATPVMMMLAFFLFEDLDNYLIGLAMLFSAGTFLYIATVDTLPDIHNPESGKKAMFHVLLGIIILTILLMVADTLDLGHQH